LTAHPSPRHKRMTFQPFQPFRAFDPFRTSIGLSRLAALIKALFGNDKAGGMWLPDPKYCYTDDGITNCTAPGDLVYRVDDISGNGNHAVQSTEASRPALGRTVEGGRRNLLSSTDTFSTGWATFSSGTASDPVVTPNAAVAPDGSTTADKADIFAGSSGRSEFRQDITSEFDGTSTYTHGLWLKAATPEDVGRFVLLRTGSNTGGFVAIELTADWVRHTVSGVPAVGDTYVGLHIRTDAALGSSQSVSVLTWGPQLEQAATATPYQRVGTTALDVTEAGKKELWYLAFDGVDDFLWNSNAVLYAAGSAYVGWAAQGEADQVDKRLFSEGSSTNTTPIYSIGFNLTASYRLYLRNNESTTLLNENTGGRTTTAPIVGRFVDTGSNMAILENAGPMSNFNYTRTGTFTADRFAIGALLRSSDVSHQKMQFFGMVTRTGALTAEQIAQTEALLASRSGVELP